RLLETSERGAQALVGGAHLVLERIEVGVLIHAPPAPARRGVRRRRLFPFAGLAVGGGWRRARRAMVVRAERAGGQRDAERERRSGLGPHEASLRPAVRAGSCAGAIRTS